MLSHAELLRKCIEVIEAFDPHKTTVDAHFADSEQKLLDKLGVVEIKFVQQVLYGCMRYQKFLKVFVHSFLYKNPAVAPWSDQTVYLIMGYLLFFRLDELGIDEFRQFIFAGLSTPPALNALLQFCFSENEINEWCRDEWCKIYDVTFIEEDIIKKLLSFRLQMQSVLNEIEFAATGKLGETADSTAAEATTKMLKTTSVRPFNLTRPKPRLIPEPTPIERVVEAKPIPKTIYATSLKEIEKEKNQRREVLREKSRAAYTSQQEFRLLTAERPGAEDQIKERFKEEMDRARMEECTFAPKLNQPYDRRGLAATDVKMNTAAILREDKLLKKKQEKEYEVLLNYECDLKDASEFYRWQQEMREKDTMDEELRVAQRKVEMQMARTEAIEASATQVRRNLMFANAGKEEIADALKKVHEHQDFVLQEKQNLVADVTKERSLARVAEQKVQNDRKQAAEDMRKEAKLDSERKAAEDAHEMERRKDLIRQIRAYERVPSVQKQGAVFDPCEPPRHGFMEEMSLTELRERLRLAREAAERAREVQHTDIQNKKESKKNDLEKKYETLKKVRKLAQTESEMRQEKRRNKKEEEDRQKQALCDQRRKEVMAKIAAKQKARADEEDRLKRELKEISIKRQFDDLKTGKDDVTLKKEGLQSGLAKYARMLDKKEEEAKRAEKVSRLRDNKIRQDNRREVHHDFQLMQQEVEGRLEASRKELAVRKEDLRNTKKKAFQTQKEFEKTLIGTRTKMLPYNAKMNDADISGARSYRRQIEELYRRGVRGEKLLQE